MEGTVESYSEEKGFGFIDADNGSRAYFYRDSIEANGYKTVSPGDRVSFEIVGTIRGPEAKKIKVF